MTVLGWFVSPWIVLQDAFTEYNPADHFNYVFPSFKTPSFSFSYITATALVLVKSGTRTHHLSTMLPQGKDSEDYNVTLKVEISDEGGSSHEDMFTVKVRKSKTHANIERLK